MFFQNNTVLICHSIAYFHIHRNYRLLILCINCFQIIRIKFYMLARFTCLKPIKHQRKFHLLFQ